MHDGSARQAALPALACPVCSLPVSFAPDQDGFDRFVLPAVLLPLLAALLAPFVLVAGELWSNADARALVTEDPRVGIQLLIGLTALVGLFGWPIARLAGAALQRQHVTIDNGLVQARASGLLGTRGWSEPLSAYTGVSHRVRSTLSGVRHELVLVHERRSRCVILPMAPQFSPEAAGRAAERLDAAEIPSRIAASVRSADGCLHRCGLQPELAAA